MQLPDSVAMTPADRLRDAAKVNAGIERETIGSTVCG